MPTQLQPPRGTHDLIGDEQRRHTHVVDTARRVAATYGFDEWTTPIFEDTRVFSRTLGETSDVVTKEMYSFTDRGGDRDHLAPGGHRRHLPRPGHQWPDPDAAAEGVSGRPDVPLRAPAEGPLPPVPPDRHRADRQRRAARRRRGDRLWLGHPAGARASPARRCWRSTRSATRTAAPPIATRWSAYFTQHQAALSQRQPGPAGAQSAAHPGQQGRGRPPHRRQRAGDRRPPDRRRRRVLCQRAHLAGPLRRAVPGEPADRARASITTAIPPSSSSPASWARRAR